MDDTNLLRVDDDFIYLGTTTRLFTIAVDGGTAAPLDIQLSKMGGFVRDGATLYVIDGGTSAPVQTDGGQWQQQLVADGRVLRYPVAGGAPETLASGLVMPQHPMLLGNDIYFDVRRCTNPDYATDAIAIVSKSGGQSGEWRRPAEAPAADAIGAPGPGGPPPFRPRRPGERVAGRIRKKG